MWALLGCLGHPSLGSNGSYDSGLGFWIWFWVCLKSWKLGSCLSARGLRGKSLELTHSLTLSLSLSIIYVYVETYTHIHIFYLYAYVQISVHIFRRLGLTEQGSVTRLGPDRNEHPYTQVYGRAGVDRMTRDSFKGSLGFL